MTNYIKLYVRRMIEQEAFSAGHFQELGKELNRLDPRDFDPQAQHEVVWLRARLSYIAQALGTDRRPTIQFLESLLPILDKYRGENSRGITRAFGFVTDHDLRRIIERDYSELSLVLFPGAAWKSCVIAAGSILEAVLYDLLTRDVARISQAMRSPKAPKDKTGSVRDITKNTSYDEWRLVNLIEVSVDLRLLPVQRADTIDQVLRDYRNFVHPKKEIRAEHECSEAEGFLAKGALDGVCNYLQQHP